MKQERYIQLTEAQLEAEANRHMVRSLRTTTGVVIAVWFLNLLGVFIVNSEIMAIGCAISLVILVLPVFLSTFVDMQKPWVKYMMMGSICLTITVMAAMLTYHVTVALCLPLILTSLYRSRRFLYVTLCVSLVGLFASVMLGYYYGLCDANMLVLTTEPTAYYMQDMTDGQLNSIAANPNPWYTLPLFFVLPRAALLTLIAYVMRFVVAERSDNAVRLFELQRDSETDKTTRFFNKAKFDHMVSTYYPQVQRVGVIFWDMNNLKMINDTYGHAQGDWLIGMMANAIYAQTDNLRRVYRVGGDEFVMVIENPEEGEVEAVMDSVRKLVESNNEKSHLKISAAVGHASGPGADVTEVVKRADEAMYENKRALSQDDDAVTSSLLNDRLFTELSQTSDRVYLFINDMETGVSRWSKHAVADFALPGEYMADVLPLWLDRIHPDDRKVYKLEIDQVFSGKKDHHHSEYRVKNAAGEYMWLECRGNVVVDQVRMKKYFVGMMLCLDARNKYDPLTKMETVYEFNNLDFETKEGALIMVGLDDFKKIVSAHGYAFGDIVLTEFAQRLMEYCEGGVRPYRLEGDEFVVYLPDADEERARDFFRSMKAMGIGLGSLGGRVVHVQFSGGAVLFPKHGKSRVELLGNLEHSLQWAKEQSRGDLVVFSQVIANVHRHNAQLQELVLSSVDSGFEGFELHYQPLVDAKTFRVRACEALLRFRGLQDMGISVEEMIHILERNGAITEMGHWIIRESFRTVKDWQSRYEKFNVGVNLSMVQFREVGFVDWVIKQAHELDIDPCYVTLELTESSDVQDMQTMREHLLRLHGAGFKIALDDFGIAYSTLLLIKTLPADAVKIDHNFILNLDKRENDTDLAIIESVIGLCETLGINVVAEGVENEAILGTLSNYPISLYQGYYFSRPVDREGFEAILNAQGSSM